jgi:hypothetical protein
MHAQLGVAAVAIASLLAGPACGSEVKAAPEPGQYTAPVPSVTVLGSRQVEGILGRPVRSRIGENLGHIVDVIVDRSGGARAVVIDFGGFLGIGNRKIAVDWGVLNFATEGDKRNVATVELTREQVRTAPEYKDRRAVIVLGAAGPIPSTPAR